MIDIVATGSEHIRRQLRVISILAAAERAALTPLPAQYFHTIAYFADALSPVWGLHILEAQLLKRPEGPLSPPFQRDVDILVGRGVITAINVTHETDDSGRWHLSADYGINEEFAIPILDRASDFEDHRAQLMFVREVVYAMSNLGLLAIRRAPGSDATYGNDQVDAGSMVNIEERTRPNLTARVAFRFRDLVRSEAQLTPAEMTHLYVRELHKRMSQAA